MKAKRESALQQFERTVKKVARQLPIEGTYADRSVSPRRNEGVLRLGYYTCECHCQS